MQRLARYALPLAALVFALAVPARAGAPLAVWEGNMRVAKPGGGLSRPFAVHMEVFDQDQDSGDFTGTFSSTFGFASIPLAGTQSRDRRVLMNVIFVARKAFAAYLISSAMRRSVNRIGESPWIPPGSDG